MSRINLGWQEKELSSILKQDKLIQDHLEPYMKTISNAKTRIQKSTCIWCIQNLITIRTM